MVSFLRGSADNPFLPTSPAGRATFIPPAPLPPPSPALAPVTAADLPPTVAAPVAPTTAAPTLAPAAVPVAAPTVAPTAAPTVVPVADDGGGIGTFFRAITRGLAGFGAGISGRGGQFLAQLEREKINAIEAEAAASAERTENLFRVIENRSEIKQAVAEGFLTPEQVRQQTGVDIGDFAGIAEEDLNTVEAFGSAGKFIVDLYGGNVERAAEFMRKNPAEIREIAAPQIAVGTIAKLRFVKDQLAPGADDVVDAESVAEFLRSNDTEGVAFDPEEIAAITSDPSIAAALPFIEDFEITEAAERAEVAEEAAVSEFERLAPLRREEAVATTTAQEIAKQTTREAQRDLQIQELTEVLGQVQEDPTNLEARLRARSLAGDLLKGAGLRVRVGEEGTEVTTGADLEGLIPGDPTRERAVIRAEEKKAAETLDKQLEAMQNVGEMGNQAQRLITRLSDPASAELIATAGGLGRFLSGFATQFEAVFSTLGLDAVSTAAMQRAFSEQGIEAAQINADIIALGFLIAKKDNPSRSPTDADFERGAAQIAGASGNPISMALVTSDALETVIENQRSSIQRDFDAGRIRAGGKPSQRLIDAWNAELDELERTGTVHRLQALSASEPQKFVDEWNAVPFGKRVYQKETGGLGARTFELETFPDVDEKGEPILRIRRAPIGGGE